MFVTVLSELEEFAADMNVDAVVGRVTAPAENRVLSYLGEHQKFLTVIERAILAAQDIVNTSTLRNDFLLGGLAREVAIMTLAAAVTGQTLLSKTSGQLVGPEDYRVISEVIGRISILVGNQIDLDTPAHTSATALARVDELLRLPAILWRTFHLERLRDSVNLRRLHFNGLCRELPLEDFTIYNPLIESTGPVLENNDGAAMVGNWILADCLRGSAELSSYYLTKAAIVAKTSALSQDLRFEAAMIALQDAQYLDADAELLLRDYISDVESSHIYRFMRNLREDEYGRHALRFLNALSGVKNADLKAHVREVLNRVAADADSPVVRRELVSIIDLYGLLDRLHQADKIDLQEVLAEWTERKDLWLYASILSTLLQNGYNDDGIRQEAATILERIPDDDVYNSFLLLALTLSEG